MWNQKMTSKKKNQKQNVNYRRRYKLHQETQI